VPVYISDYSKWRLDFAESLGGIPVDLSAGDPTGVPPLDAAIDTSGKSAGRRTALGVLSKRGVLACVGHGEGLELDVSVDLIAPERTVMGSEYFRFDEMAGNLEILLANREYLSRIITHTVPRSEIARAFELFLGGETGKVVVVAD
jgi:threonine dehydrogenase-like Zn-dependent dehydrogenase